MTRRRSNKHIEEETDSGSIWTSYSDMFTTMAIIFLVMFVFALIKSGVTSLKTAQQAKEHKDFLEGQVTEKVKEQNNLVKTKIDDSLKEINSYQKIFDQKVKDLKNLNTKMQDHKKLITKVLKEDSKKDIVIKELRSTLVKQKENLKVLKSQSKQEKQKASQFEKEKTKLVNQIQKTEDTLKKVSVEKFTKQNEIKRLTKELEDKKAMSSKMVTQVIALKNDLALQSQSNEKIKKQLSEALESKKKLTENTSSFKKQFDEQSKKIEDLMGKLSSKEQVIQNLTSEKGHFAQELKKAKAEKKKVQRSIASNQRKIRSDISKKIAERFRKGSIKVKLDKETGTITLLMDDSFLFKRNDSKLSHTAKDTLKKLIPPYIDELFKDKIIRDSISSINIIGHASPRYKQQVVEPNTTDYPDAYSYNLDLSSDRAKEIVKYIFSDDFGDFNYKNLFRVKVSSIGKSFSRPIRYIASEGQKKKDKCGSYNCRLSRRVEISFSLKDNSGITERLEELSKKNK